MDDEGLSVSLLGPLLVRRDGQDVDLGWRLRRLLAGLAVARGSVVGIDRLIDVVWTDDQPEAASRTLPTYITRLRRALAPDRPELIVSRPPGYALQIGDDELDSARFESELDEAARLLAMAEHDDAVELLQSALGRWRGRALDGYEDTDWARPEAVRLEERRFEAREALIEAWLGAGAAQHASAEARAIVEEAPLRERPRALLMRALYTSGRQADALREFQRYRSDLADETGLEPSPDLVELEQRIVLADPTLNGPLRSLRGYVLGPRLGQSDHAVVHRATQPSIGREVAIKIIRGELADQPGFIRRFELEARAVGSIEHPNIVPLFDFWREPGAAYLVMRHMRGGSLEARIRNDGPFDVDRALDVVCEVGSALDAAHSVGVVHGRLSLSNILFDEAGSAHLGDFGVATADGVHVLEHRPTDSQPPSGIPLDDERATRIDVCGLALVCADMLLGDLRTGEAPVGNASGGNEPEPELPRVRSTRPELPTEVDDVLGRAVSPTDGPSTIAAFVGEITRALGARRSSGSRPLHVGQIATPFKGLHAFEENDAHLFFGREQLVDEIVDRVRNEPLVAVVGPSGSGKSSVVRAGVVPAVRGGAIDGSERWFITTMRPGRDPIGALESALERIAVEPLHGLRSSLDERGGLVRALRRILPVDGTALLVIDQFEELFTSVGSADVRQRFLTELGSALDRPDTPLRIIATLRADHYDAPLRSANLAEHVHRGTVAVRPMQPDELQRAIVEPARAVGVDVEPALVAQLVAGVTDEPAALPLLQFALTEVFERRVQDVMLLETHTSLGGLTGALAARAERILDRGDAEDVAAARRIFGRLVAHTDDAGVDLRRRARLSELGDDERILRILESFTAARLLVRDRDPATREPTVEVAHEALLRDWPRLAAWIEQDGDDVRLLHRVHEGALAWEASGHDDGELARGGRLELAAELAARRPDLVNQLELRWIEQSEQLARDAAERDRRDRRRLRRLVAAGAALAAVALAAATVALVLRNRSQTNERIAVENERRAEESARLARDSELAGRARELVLEGEKLLGEDPQLATLLAVEAIASFRSAGQPVPSTATDLIRRAIVEHRTVGELPGGNFVDVSSDGAMLLTRGDGDGSALWDVETLSPVETLAPPDGMSVRTAWFWDDVVYAMAEDESTVEVVRRSDDGDWVTLVRGIDRELADEGWFGGDARHFVARTDGVLRAWNTTGGRVIDVGVDRPLWSADVDGRTTFDLSSDGRLAFAGPDGVIHLVDVASGGELTIIEPDAELAPSEIEPTFVLFSDDGTRLAALEGDTRITVYEVPAGTVTWSYGDLPRGDFVQWADGDAQLVIAGESGVLRFDSESGEPLGEVGSSDAVASDVAAVPGSSLVALAALDDTTTLVDLGLQAGRDVVDSFTLPLEARSMAIADDGTRLTALSQEDAVVVDLPIATQRHLRRGLRLRETNPIRDVNFFTVPVMSLDGSYIASPDPDGRSQLWDAETGAVRYTAPDGWDIRAVGNRGDRVVIFRQANDDEPSIALLVDGDGNEVDVPIEPDQEVVRGAFTPDDDVVILTALESGVWSGESGERIGQIGIPDAFLGGFVDISREGAWIARASDGRLELYDGRGGFTGDMGHDRLVFSVDAANSAMSPFFSPDASFIATVGRGEAVKVWSIDGALVATIDVEIPDAGAAFHPTEPWVYVADGEDVTVYSLDVDELLEIAAADVRRSLTEEECQRHLHGSCDEAAVGRPGSTRP